MGKLTSIPCPSCGNKTKPIDRWTFSRYIARRHECLGCGSTFETHEAVANFDPSKNIVGLSAPAVEYTDTTAQPHSVTTEPTLDDYFNQEDEGPNGLG